MATRDNELRHCLIGHCMLVQFFQCLAHLHFVIASSIFIFVVVIEISYSEFYFDAL